jgi:hypothetical protein
MPHARTSEVQPLYLILQLEEIRESSGVKEVGVWVADCCAVVERKQLLRKLHPSDMDRESVQYMA